MSNKSCQSTDARHAHSSVKRWVWSQPSRRTQRSTNEIRLSMREASSLKDIFVRPIGLWGAVRDKHDHSPLPQFAGQAKKLGALPVFSCLRFCKAAGPVRCPGSGGGRCPYPERTSSLLSHGPATAPGDFLE